MGHFSFVLFWMRCFAASVRLIRQSSFIGCTGFSILQHWRILPHCRHIMRKDRGVDDEIMLIVMIEQKLAAFSKEHIVARILFVPTYLLQYQLPCSTIGVDWIDFDLQYAMNVIICQLECQTFDWKVIFGCLLFSLRHSIHSNVKQHVYDIAQFCCKFSLLLLSNWSAAVQLGACGVRNFGCNRNIWFVGSAVTLVLPL